MFVFCRQACTNSKEEDIDTSCCCFCIQDVKPRPLDPSDIYQQFEIIEKKHLGFFAKSVAPDGNPPEFLRRKYWRINMHEPRNYQLSEAQGLNSSLRACLPEFNFSLSNGNSKPIVVGKWYCPFVFVKEDMELKDQMNISTFYEMTLEQRWEKFFGCDNVESDQKMVAIDVVVEREEAFVAGRKAVWEERKLENGMIWFRSCDGKEGKEVKRVGLSIKILERMKWEQERVGWVGGDEKQVRIERREEFGGINKWKIFGCYVLVERFVLKRMNGSIILAHDFRHIHHIRSKWE